jgi:hypothetical protein
MPVFPEGVANPVLFFLKGIPCLSRHSGTPLTLCGRPGPGCGIFGFVLLFSILPGRNDQATQCRTFLTMDHRGSTVPGTLPSTQ